MPDSKLLSEAASLFVIGFTGTAADRELQQLIQLGVAGCILFRRNIETPAQVLSLNTQLKKMAGDRPLLIELKVDPDRMPPLTH